jgi:type IV secretory pathway VirB10-like protein
MDEHHPHEQDHLHLGGAGNAAKSSAGRSTMRKTLAVVMAALGLTVASCSVPEAPAPETETTTITTTPVPPAEPSPTPTPEATPAASPTPEPEPPAEPEMTVGQENAYGSAMSYLSMGGFSRTGLIDQLIYEGFSAEDAEFAVSKIEQEGGVDWMEQAAKSAASYQEFASMSRQELKDQLLYEGFTEEQAEHGVVSVGY